MSEQHTKVTHAIFDLGQTIVDTKSTTESILHEDAKSKGKQWTAIEPLEEVDSYSEYFTSYSMSIGDDFHKHPDKLHQMIRTMIEKCFIRGFPLISGVKKLIRHLHNNNIPMAIATNGTQPDLNGVFNAIIGFEPALFSHFVTGGDDPEVLNNKPAPDIYLVCAKRFNPTPKSLDNCVIFEDSLRGITGAVASGMKTVLINERKTDIFDSIADKITVIVDSFDNFSPESVGLPPY